MRDHQPANLATEKLSRLMGQYALPCVISLLVGAHYNIIDQIFIANAATSHDNSANTCFLAQFIMRYA